MLFVKLSNVEVACMTVNKYALLPARMTVDFIPPCDPDPRVQGRTIQLCIICMDESSRLICGILIM